MFAIGKHNRLPVLKQIGAGLLLGEEDDPVLLPNRKVPEGAKVGDVLSVFVYTDSEDRPVATTETPKASVGDIVTLEVIDTSRHGAFLDWGLDKDLIVPTREQHQPLREGDRVVVAVLLDRDDRVMATSKLAPHLDRRTKHLKAGKAVEYLIYGSTERGYRAVVDGRFNGMLFRDDTPQRLRMGDAGRAWITGVRPDGRLDLSLRAPGRSVHDDARSIVLAALEDAGGFVPLNDKSDPDQIRERLHMSKKVFKRAIGGLYKERRIEIGDDGIRRIDR